MGPRPRSQKPGLDKDFRDLLSKPVDTPHGPYADSFGEQQHKYGPFAPIRAMLARLKAETTGGRTPPRPAGPAHTRSVCYVRLFSPAFNPLPYREIPGLDPAARPRLLAGMALPLNSGTITAAAA